MTAPSFSSHVLLGFAALVGLFACGGSQTAPTRANDAPLANRAQDQPAQRPGSASSDAEAVGTMTDRDAVAAALLVLDDMARAAAGSAGNCGVAASQVAGPVQANEPLWQHLAEMSRDSEREKLLIAAQPRIAERMERFAEALGPCAYDARVRMSLEGVTFANP